MSRVAVFVDGDNMPALLLPTIIEYAKKQGDILYFKIFGNQEAITTWQAGVNKLKNNKLEIQFRQNPVCKKNSSDIAMTIEVIEFLMRNKTDCFCLVSSDSDFSSVIDRIRQNPRKRVVVVAHKNVGKHLYSLAHDALQITPHMSHKVGKKAVSQQHVYEQFIALVKQAILANQNIQGLTDVSTIAQHLHQNKLIWRQFGVSKLSRLLAKSKVFSIRHQDGICYACLRPSSKNKRKKLGLT